MLSKSSLIVNFINGGKPMFRCKILFAAVVVAGLSSAAVQADPLSERAGQVVVDHLQRSLNAKMSYQRFELDITTPQVVATEVRVTTALKQLDDGLNEVLQASSIRVTGEWLTAHKQQLILTAMQVQDSQLTIAYFGKGQSNLHSMLEHLRAPKAQPAAMQLVWQLEQVQLDNVVVNLFDNGRAILSVRLAQLMLPQLPQDGDTSAYIKQVLWPIFDQVVAGKQGDVVVDTPRLLQFMWREAR
jgi:hypothetical protein